ncbi:MAG: glycosyltransferase [Lachnospiraceae bacterium]|nr:glycosyltransferase [Lachnospiraceae bacterium]
MRQGLVSIIVPCYNVEKYIEKCLLSICKQTYKQLEIICIDDGSTDGTVRIIKHLIQKDERIKLFRQENLFAGVARNRGIDESNGEYICFLDGDDFFEEHMIETMVGNMIENHTEIVLCDAFFFDDKTKEITKPLWVLNKEVLKKCDSVFSYKNIPENIFEVSWSVPWNKLYKRSFIFEKKIRFQNIKRHNDEYFASMSLVLARKISYVEERLVYYRRNNDTSLQAYTPEEKFDKSFFYALLEIRDELKKQGIYDAVESCFKDKCLVACVNLLKKQKTLKNYKELYEFLKKTAFGELNITDKTKTKYTYCFEEYKKIVRLDVDEYLFQNVNEKEELKQNYRVPYYLLGDCSKIVIYAAGKVGREYYKQLLDQEFYYIIAWVDKNYKKLSQRGLPISNPVELQKLEFDKVLIAIENKKVKEEVKNELIKLGVEPDKIV